ncbi:hypothetical protein [Dokdonella sp.]|uniref:hypothetical protein n=1 Tax=Dokdonella sp. TaxID=2291710 RepID=UPI0031CC32F7|nr:hypothetical protein [Dokdonella sp.]
MIGIALGLFSSQAVAGSISLNCTPGLCIVGVDTTNVDLPIDYAWNIDVGTHNVLFPHPCEGRKTCMFICPEADDPIYPVAFPASVDVTVRDANGGVLGSASTITSCAAVLW